MTNKKIYIEEQLEFAKMNRLLLTEEPNVIVKELLEESSIYDIVTLIDSYISMLENLHFIRYFDSARENLISTIQILIFCLFRYCNCTNEYPFLYEEELETLMQNLELLKNMNLPIEDKYEKEEEYRDKKEEYDYQKEESKCVLFSYRNMDALKNSDFNLIICYLLDEKLIKYINGKSNRLIINDKIYPLYLYSLYFYIRTISLVLDKKKAKKRIAVILNYNNSQFIQKRKELRVLADKMIETKYVDAGVDPLCVDLYSEGFPLYDEKDIQIQTNIVDIREYVKKR